MGGSAFAVGERIQAPSVAQQRCTNGAVRGIAVVTGIASQGIANFPDSFTAAGNLFGRKFNCTGKAVQARRVETGVFEVRFVGISGASACRQRARETPWRRCKRRPAACSEYVMHPAGRDDRVDLPFTIVVV